MNKRLIAPSVAFVVALFAYIALLLFMLSGCSALGLGGTQHVRSEVINLPTIEVTSEFPGLVHVYVNNVKLGVVTTNETRCFRIHGIYSGPVRLMVRGTASPRVSMEMTSSDFTLLGGWSISLGPTPNTWIFDLIRGWPTERCLPNG